MDETLLDDKSFKAHQKVDLLECDARQGNWAGQLRFRLEQSLVQSYGTWLELLQVADSGVKSTVNYTRLKLLQVACFRKKPTFSEQKFDLRSSNDSGVKETHYTQGRIFAANLFGVINHISFCSL